MHSLRSVPAGTVITRVYFSVPGFYTTGEHFDDWDAAVTHAPGPPPGAGRRADRVRGRLQHPG